MFAAYRWLFVTFQILILGPMVGLNHSAAAQQTTVTTAPQPADKPNIVFVLTDNLGYGEIGCYGGGLTRGAPTPRIDSLCSLEVNG